MERSAIEQQLRRLPDVIDARIEGDTSSPISIRVVAPRRPEKQVVRDVRSLLTAMFGIEIDHHLVSVIRGDELPEREAPASPSGRVALERIVEVHEATTSRVGSGCDTPMASVSTGKRRVVSASRLGQEQQH